MLVKLLGILYTVAFGSQLEKLTSVYKSANLILHVAKNKKSISFKAQSLKKSFVMPWRC